MPSLVTWCCLAPLVYVGIRAVQKLFTPGPFENVPGPKPVSRLLGNLPQFFDQQGWEFQRDLSESYGRVVKLSMPFGAKWLFVFDPKALHEIVIKHQDVYEETPIFRTGNALILGQGLLATIGDHHRQQRKMLNPSFAPGHLKEIFPLMLDVIHKLHQALSEQIAQDAPKELDMLDWTTRTALEAIGQCGLGYSFDPLTEHAQNPCGEAFKALEPTIFPMHVMRILLPYIVKIGSAQFRRRLLEWTPYPRLQRVREIVDTMDATAKEILRVKRAALERGDEELGRTVGQGKDILSTLHVQDKLREEITKMHAQLSQDGLDLTYDVLLGLPYLDAVCKETLRLFPAVPFIGRRTQEPITMRLSEPMTGVNGDAIDSIFIPVQSTVIIGIAASNTDRAIWGDDAHEWKPERWMSADSCKTDSSGTKVPGVYNNMMTFLGGGRTCIGYKFAEMEMKAILYTLLPSFRFDPPADKEICWNLAGILYPTVGKTSKKVEMPLKITLIRP
ncbi:cytochrome P450-dit2 [Steccherinum ochraceum]|uniref:Cytochrome P450-dit2 n=1 Tax=Steccherinum ochraceum TaxID=92696 RepID=A0A4R0RG19_9APHY|nr:cytochrome P450-dit2 [Steccherinum ochraceum]